MKTFYLLLISAAISLTSCHTKQGEPGPAGESGLIKQGTVSATITYTNDAGNDATTSLNYQYYESIEQNYFTYDENGTDSYYELNFQRRDLKDVNNYFRFDLEGYGSNGIEENPDYTSTDFTFLTVVNNEIIGFQDENVTITDLTLDHTTGRVTFNFTGTVYDINDDQATITGKVDVILNRLIRNNNNTAMNPQAAQ